MSTSRFPARRAAIVASAALLLLLAACGSSNVVKDGALAKDKGVPTVPIPTTTTTLPSAAGKPCKPATDIKPEKGQPTSVLMPKGVPPKSLGKSDLTVGTGTAAKVGDSITANYLGISCSTGKEFQSSWGSSPFTATLSTSGIIPGWYAGIPGMKVGGLHELVIPPALAYGNDPQAGSGIAPGETLVFVIQLLKVAAAPPATTTTAAGATTTAPAATSTTKPASTTSTTAATSTTVAKSTGTTTTKP